MADDDNFDIDIYGEDDQGAVSQTQTLDAAPTSAADGAAGDGDYSAQEHDETTYNQSQPLPLATHGTDPQYADQTSGMNLDGHAEPSFETPDYSYEPDPDATPAIIISDLQWWITDDDIRGWANHCRVEHTLQEITFSEHKVNGKCKGYGNFPSPTYCHTN